MKSTIKSGECRPEIITTGKTALSETNALGETGPGVIVANMPNNRSLCL